MGMEEVFDARIVSWPTISSSSFMIEIFRARFSGTGSITIGEGEAIECRVSLGGVELAPTDRAVEGLLQPLTRRRDKFG